MGHERVAFYWKIWQTWFGSVPFNVLLVGFIATRRKRFCITGDPSITPRHSSRYLFSSRFLNRIYRLTLVSTCLQIGGSYKCNPCDFWCENNESMDSHLLSTSHRDVVSMMNGSLPVVVGRQRALSCGSCDRRFRYNLQLRLHVKETGHEGSMTASDAYQQRIRCNLCPQIVRSLVALQRHQLTCHATKEEEKKEKEKEDRTSQSAPYFCSFCSMNFVTAQEAVLHRRTSSHKEIVKARKCNRDSSTSTIRECPHCAEKQTNLSEHKTHLLENHPELCHR